MCQEFKSDNYIRASQQIFIHTDPSAERLNILTSSHFGYNIQHSPQIQTIDSIWQPWTTQESWCFFFKSYQIRKDQQKDP